MHSNKNSINTSIRQTWKKRVSIQYYREVAYFLGLFMAISGHQENSNLIVNSAQNANNINFPKLLEHIQINLKYR